MRVRNLICGSLLCLAGCAISRLPAIDDGFFACQDASQCGPGQACAEGNVYSADFCRPACNQSDPTSCSGVCTARGACLERCTIGSDGQASPCRSPDFTCVRTDAMQDEGVCYPVRGCSRDADCPQSSNGPQQCLNEALGLPATTGSVFRFDNLYCTAAPDENQRCPEGYLNFEITTPTGPRTFCYAPCGIDSGSPDCPPATVCFHGAGELIGSATSPPCLAGVFGLPCVDDTQCLIGRCLDVGGGHRACTETCADAASVGGCESLEGFSEYVSVTARIRCENVDGNEVCVPRYDLLSVCSEQLECVAGVPCQLVSTGTQLLHVCYRRCTTADECAAGTGGMPSDYRCRTADGACMRKLAAGARCVDDQDCRSGMCRMMGPDLICLSG